jgi:Holliday junction DNA helicase RuvA
MFEHLRGAIDRITPTEVVIDVQGVGYLLNISVATYEKISKLREAKLLVHEVIREDTHDLYGFAEAQERELFRLLIGVSGVGPNTARMILSSMTAAQLQQAVASGDHSMLKAVKGIGLKTAQRIVVDLKDKITLAGLMAADGADAASLPARGDVYDEALAALVMLGFNRPAAQKALTKLFAADPTVSAESAIKQALKML